MSGRNSRGRGGLFDIERPKTWLRAIRTVRHDFHYRHKCAPSLFRPRKFSEKMQWRKLFDLNPLYAVLSDKLAARYFIAARAGEDVLVPMLWSGDDPANVPFDTLEPPYVVKSTHAAGQSIIVLRREDVDAEKFRTQMQEWLAYCHGTRFCEPGYVPVPRRIMVERLLREPDDSQPLERLMFVFHGRVRMIQTRVFENGKLRHGAFHDRDWRPVEMYLTTPPLETELARPARLDEMILLAERLGEGLDHVRVDLYDCHDRIRVGELTLYSWSGHYPTNPREADYALGSEWNIKYPALRALWTLATKPYAIDVDHRH